MTDSAITTPTPRRDPTAQELFDLVDAEVESLVQAKAEFTAYTITQNLRTAHPDIEIVHDHVRPRVRFQMDQLDYSQFPYGIEQRDFNGNPALMYVPVVIQVLTDDETDDTVNPSTPAQLPPVAGTRIDWDD